MAILASLWALGLVLDLTDFHGHWHLEPRTNATTQLDLETTEANMASLLQGMDRYQKAAAWERNLLAAQSVSPPRNPAVRLETTSSTRRDPAGFEHKERRLAAASKQRKCGNFNEYAGHNARTCPNAANEVTATAGPSQCCPQRHHEESDSEEDNETDEESRSQLNTQVSGSSDESRGSEETSDESESQSESKSESE
ncbi:hypothetical protein DFS34DRAFT_590304 [Phlyctochytrium arcticum]|nr:hypothetical protein DFS34DRAFT_590304 [Phlyctochytrium arcticum]